MREKITVLIILSSFVFQLMGCTTLNKNSPTKTLGTQKYSKFSDVPVPSGFKEVPAKSYYFESSGIRVGVLKYQGKANPEQVINFYKEQMPMYGWGLLNVIEYGDRIMNFDRQKETCIINLSGRGNRVTLTISLGPKSQISEKSRRGALK